MCTQFRFDIKSLIFKKINYQESIFLKDSLEIHFKRQKLSFLRNPHENLYGNLLSAIISSSRTTNLKFRGFGVKNFTNQKH